MNKRRDLMNNRLLLTFLAGLTLHCGGGGKTPCASGGECLNGQTCASGSCEANGPDGGGGGSGGSGGGGAAVVRQASIQVIQSCTSIMGAEYCSGRATASFSSLAPQMADQCSTSIVNGCEVVECVSLDGGTLVPAPPESAGVLIIAGTRADGGITMTFGASGYPDYTSLTRLFDGGETLTVSATGATVPGFSGHSLVAPYPIVVTAPACSQFACGTFSRSASLPVSWSGTASEVTASFVAIKPNHSIAIACKLTSSPASIGASAMARLGRNDAGFRTTSSSCRRARSASMRATTR